jgi:chromosome segregation ATPase
MSGYIKNLSVILSKAQGVIDADTDQPIDIGGEVLSIRQECDELRARLAAAMQEREIAGLKAANREAGVQSDRANKLASQVFGLTREIGSLRAEVARLKEIAAEFAQTNVEINGKWFSEKQAREAAEARLRELREAVEAAPHHDQCACWHGPCNCWKAAALAKSGEPLSP